MPPYYDHPAYLDAIAAVIRDDLAQLPWEPEHFVCQLPRHPAAATPSAATRTRRTSCGRRAALVERLGWPREQWTQTYQSLFGRDEWLKPYTDDVLTTLAKRGVQARVRGDAGLHGRLPGDDRRDRPRVGGGVPPRRRRGAAPVPVPERPPGVDRRLTRIVRDEGRGWL